MKKLEFETSKGRFLVVDGIDVSVYGATFVTKLSEITEEEASEIVELKEDRFQDYNHISCCDRWCNTAIESLHSLLKSKGVHLFDNPIDLDEQLDCNCDMCYQKLEDSFDEAEQKTFYNPYIFKS